MDRVWASPGRDPLTGVHHMMLTMPTQKTVKSRNQGRSVQLRSSSGLHSLFVL